MKLRNTAIAFGIGAATALGLSLLKVDKLIIVGSTVVVASTGLILSRRKKEQKDIKYQLSEDEWEYVEILRNYDEKLSQKEWQEKYAIRTKKDWKKLEKELNKEWEEVWEGPPRRTLKKTNLDISLPEIKSDLQLANLGIPRVQLLLGEGYTTAKDLSGMSFDDLLNIHHNLTWQGILNIYIALRANKLITKELLLELEDSLQEVEYEWTKKEVPYKQLKYKLEPDNDRELSTKYFKEAWSKESLGNYEGAIIDFTKAIELNPSNYGYFKRRAHAKHQYKDLNGAIKDYNNSIELNPIHAETYKLRGFTKELIGDIQGAIDDYSESIEHLSKEIARGQINDFSVKIDVGGKGNSKNEAIGWCYCYRGKAKKKLVDFKGACLDWWKASRLDNKEAAKLFEEHCDGYLEIEDYEILESEAKDHSEKYDLLTKMIQIKPNNVDLYLRRGHAAKEIEFLKGSYLDWKEATNLGSDEASKLLEEHCKDYIHFYAIYDQISNQKPSSEIALIEELDRWVSQLIEEAKNGRASWADSRVINEFAHYCDTTSYEPMLEEEKIDWWEEQRGNIAEFYTVKDAKELVERRLSNCDYEETECYWGIGEGTHHECEYQDEESFKEDINWERLVEIVKQSWNKVCEIQVNE
ncbi:hypothetical protein [Prochlorococcus sp. MIT 1223]|uniref:tetratricopeptide repeat protein n=1 Tax=Prochlorococcus sp. MIT 1223 TaxID=3096217 RepID=UPI002A753881|nr:hypothetical protein [Prochlorococcus sp. MIT 1223]